MATIFELGSACLEECDPERKVALTLQAEQALADDACTIDAAAPPAAIERPGRPVRPELVPHSRLAGRGLGSAAGRAAFVHALAHIEFNAINLAWDAVCRFRGLPDDFYRDWVCIASEEAQHFRLLADRLVELDSAYGAFPAHDGLWEMAARTAHDPLVRMALVPRVLEARGLDVTPAMIRRLDGIGDTRTVAILARIYRDEIGHVEKGTRWFRFLCEQRRLEPAETFRALLVEYRIGRPRPPLNDTAREQAGFATEELAMLYDMAETGP